jgi:hypothetical protein
MVVATPARLATTVLPALSSKCRANLAHTRTKLFRAPANLALQASTAHTLQWKLLLLILLQALSWNALKGTIAPKAQSTQLLALRAPSTRQLDLMTMEIALLALQHIIAISLVKSQRQISVRMAIFAQEVTQDQLLLMISSLCQALLPPHPDNVLSATAAQPAPRIRLNALLQLTSPLLAEAPASGALLAVTAKVEIILLSAIEVISAPNDQTSQLQSQKT